VPLGRQPLSNRLPSTMNPVRTTVAESVMLRSLNQSAATAISNVGRQVRQVVPAVLLVIAAWARKGSCSVTRLGTCPSGSSSTTANDELNSQTTVLSLFREARNFRLVKRRQPKDKRCVGHRRPAA